MASADDSSAAKTEELASIIREIRERVRARHPAAGREVPLADLMPLVHARDAAEAKVAAIGSVNPRRSGLINGAIQASKRLIARALNWHVREQVEFNRASVAYMNTAIEALNEANCAMSRIESAMLDRHESQAREIQDLRSHWTTWRPAWERRMEDSETRQMRNVADLQGAFGQRVARLDASFRELVRSQHADFDAALAASAKQIQERLWDDLARVRAGYEELIQSELRVLRQRTAAQEIGDTSPIPHFSTPEVPRIDYLRFSDRFRGAEERVRETQRPYVDRFRECGNVLDLGCGRGEFLDLMKETGIPARGVEASAELSAYCRSKGLDAECADLFSYLSELPDSSLDGVFCAQVIEHLPPARVPELVNLVAKKLAPRGLLVIETPNPECLAIFATHFYLDPTHSLPVPAPLLAFYLEEAGFGSIEIQRLSPAGGQIPELAALPADLRNALFGGLDYAAIARRLGGP